MKAAIVWDACGTSRDAPFVHAEFVTVTTCVPGSQGLDVAKRSVIPHKGGINVGAIHYPYRGDDEPFASLEVRAVKSANRIWRYVVDDQGDKCEVRYNKDKHHWCDVDGVQHQKSNVQHLWFDSRVLAECNRRKARGDALHVPQAYYEWLHSLRASSRTVDVGRLTGKDMAFCVDKVYFNPKMTPVNELPVPEFYLQYDHELEYNEEVLNKFMLKCGRHDPLQPPLLLSELPPGFNCVLRQAWNDNGWLHLEIERVRPRTHNGQLISVECTGDTRELVFPNENDQAELKHHTIANRDPKPEDMIHRFQQLVRVVPYSKSYYDQEAVAKVLGPTAVQWVTNQIIDQYRPQILGKKGIALSLLREIPHGVKENQFFVRNARTVHLVEGDTRMLVQDVNSFVKVDLLRHRWWGVDQGVHQQPDKRQHHPKQQNRHQPSSGIGDMVARAAAAAGSVIA